MTPPLHDYQIVARDFLRARGRAGLLLDMGLGKTAASLAALEPRHLPALVIAPKRVAETVWPAEVAKFRPDLTIKVAARSRATRAAALTSGADVITLGRDNIRDLLDVTDPPWQTVIVDELSGFKSQRSVRFKTLKKYIAENQTPYVWGLTGTPTPNGLMDMWAQAYLFDGGEALGRNITAFRGRYFYPGRQLPSGVVTEWVLRPGAEERIHQRLEGMFLSMQTDGRIEVPPVSHNEIVIQLPPKVRQIYKKMKRDLVADLEVFGGEIHTAANAAVLSGKLSQISAGFLYPDDEGGVTDLLHSEKVNAVREVVEGSGGSPVLVFYRFAAERQMLAKAFPEARLVTEDGVIEEWNAGDVPVMLAHPASAGHGLNLQHGGHTIVWTTLPWSLEEWEQANKRLARQGQKHPVVIHRVSADKTIDALVYAALTDKARVQDALLAHLESPI